MALVLSEEQSMLRDSARGLISDKAPVAHLRGLRDTNQPIAEGGDNSVVNRKSVTIVRFGRGTSTLK